MKYDIKTLLAISSIAIILLSCHNEEYIYSGLYNSESATYSKVRMFTKSGEINNQTVIQNFFDHQDYLFNLLFEDRENFYSSNFILNQDSILEVDDLVSIEFLSDNKAHINFNNFSEIGHIINLADGFSVIESDTIFRQFGLWTNEFEYSIYTYYPFNSETYGLSPSTGLGTITYQNNCYYFDPKKNEIEFPMMTCFFLGSKNVNQVSSSFMRSKVNNLFDESSINLLNDNDTLVVQQFNIIITKK